MASVKAYYHPRNMGKLPWKATAIAHMLCKTGSKAQEQWRKAVQRLLWLPTESLP